MDRKTFSPNAPGRFFALRWEDRASDAFIPNGLPPDWQVSQGLWPLVVEARSRISLLEGVSRRLINPGLLLDPFSRREAIQSSRIEGTYASPRQLLIFEKGEQRQGDLASNNSREVSNYRQALREGEAHALPLSLRLIRDLHRTLMTNVRGGDKTPGEFRKMQVAIGDNLRFVPPPPQELLECLDQLEKYFHSETKGLDPLVDCFLVHYQFETIHPFQDGNGRVGRLLLTLMIQRRCGMTRPWLYLSDYIERHRREYVDRLYEVSTRAAWDDWVRFCLNAVIFQADDTIARCDKLMALQADYLKRIGTKGKRARLIHLVQKLFEDPFLGIAELSAKENMYYQAAQSRLEELARLGIVRELPNFQRRTFYAPEIYAIAYEDLGAVDE